MAVFSDMVVAMQERIERIHTLPALMHTASATTI